MGLFSTVLHVYGSNQTEIIKEIVNELRESRNFSNFNKLDIDNSNYETVISNTYSNDGVYYLITDKYNNWTTLIEVNVKIENPFYLYELTNGLSKRLNTYALSFHLHDGDVLYYNLEYKGEPLDGYSSDLQYFLEEPALAEEITSQRHNPIHFKEILPSTKTVEGFNSILNEGYWNAFDNNDLDEDGIPNDDKYFVDEEDRFVRIGLYLELYSADDYPFAYWHSNLSKLELGSCYLIKTNF